MKRAISVLLCYVLIFSMCGCAAKVEVPSDTIELFLGDTANMEATTKDLPISYSSSDPSVATVDESGDLLAVGIGEAIITATSSKGQTANRNVVVSHIEPTELSISDTTAVLGAGDKVSLSISFIPLNTTDTIIEWTTSDDSVVTVSEKGEVSARRNGNAVVTATSGNGIKAACSVTVIEDTLQKLYIDTVKSIHDQRSDNSGFTICGDILICYYMGTFWVNTYFCTEGNSKVISGFAAFGDDGNLIDGVIFEDDGTGMDTLLSDSFSKGFEDWDIYKNSYGFDIINGQTIANILGYAYKDYTIPNKSAIDDIISSSDNVLTNGSINIETIINATMGEKNALKKARDYFNVGNFSYSGLIKQLRYNGFSNSEATFAADHCGADWKMQAALKAQAYLSLMPFSSSGLAEQLQYEGFTMEQIAFALAANGYR